MKNDAVLTERKQRIEYIDCAKFICIFLLLVEHAGNWSDLSGGGYSALKLWICSFHMPLFFYRIWHGVKLQRTEILERLEKIRSASDQSIGRTLFKLFKVCYNIRLSTKRSSVDIPSALASSISRSILGAFFPVSMLLI